MRVCDQFTDERVARFFPPLNHELEVHSSVDIDGVPSVVELGLELPVVVVGVDEKRPRGANPLTMDDGVGLAQGERVLGVQSYRDVDVDAVHAPRYIHEDEMGEVFQDGLGVSPDSLEEITHTIVELDWMRAPLNGRKLRQDSPFESDDAIVIPIDEPMPHIDDSLGLNEAFIVKGFVNKKGEMVKWLAEHSAARWLVDMCVMNEYTHNRVELGLLRYALGNEASLLGLVSVSRDVSAYLTAFDERVVNNRSGLTFTPSSEPRDLSYTKKFPELTEREFSRLQKLTEASYRAMTTPVRSALR